MSDPRRDIPSVDRLLGTAPFAALLTVTPRKRVVAALRDLQRELRAQLQQANPAFNKTRSGTPSR
jgi:hypothetical protein